MELEVDNTDYEDYSDYADIDDHPESEFLKRTDSMMNEAIQASNMGTNNGIEISKEGLTNK